MNFYSPVSNTRCHSIGITPDHQHAQAKMQDLFELTKQEPDLMTTLYEVQQKPYQALLNMHRGSLLPEGFELSPCPDQHRIELLLPHPTMSHDRPTKYLSQWYNCLKKIGKSSGTLIGFKSRLIRHQQHDNILNWNHAWGRKSL